MFSYVNSLFFFHKGREYVNVDELMAMRSAKTGDVILNLLFVLLFMNPITLDLSLFVYFPKSFSHFSKRLLKVF